MSENIRDRIVSRRRERIQSEGHCFGQKVPETRVVSLVPFARDPLCICEIKRKSPSRGSLAAELDPVSQARLYREQGCQSISVLTEEDFFGGSLSDLMTVKTAFPDIAVLRKDFIIDEEDIRVSWRAGADAILLIASMLRPEEIERFHKLALSLGMEVLVEVHSQEEITKVRPCKPSLMGINCRNLETFSLDLLLPLRLRSSIDWPARVVFESGLFSRGDARFAARQNFQGILVGEAVVKRPELVGELRAGMGEGTTKQGSESPDRFWNHVAARLGTQKKSATSGSVQSTSRRPLVKICGLSRVEDVECAANLGADILGFVFAESPRRASLELLHQIAHIPLPKVAVVVAKKKNSGKAASLPEEVLEAWRRGLIDAVQFSGDEEPEECEGFGLPFYKALRPKTAAELAGSAQYRCPRLLIDAWSPSAYGGSGHSADEDSIKAMGNHLWLAGGITPANLVVTISTWHPELVDLASGIESSPGIKSHELMEQFFKELKNV